MSISYQTVVDSERVNSRIVELFAGLTAKSIPTETQLNHAIFTAIDENFKLKGTGGDNLIARGKAFALLRQKYSRYYQMAGVGTNKFAEENENLLSFSDKSPELSFSEKLSLFADSYAENLKWGGVGLGTVLVFSGILYLVWKAKK